MNQQFLLPMARNMITGQTMKTQDLNGTRFTQSQRKLAEDQCQQFALRLTARTGQTWQGFLKTYTPTQRL